MKILNNLTIRGDDQVIANAATPFSGNINSLIRPGQYGVASNASNIPVAQAGMLYVANYSTGQWCQQTYITNPDEGEIRVFHRGAMSAGNTSWSGWKEIGAAKGSGYDTIISSQAEFEEWYKELDNETYAGSSVLFLSGTYTRNDGKGLHLPDTLKQLHGLGTVKIIITKFAYSASTNKGGIWYTTTPTTEEYSIENIYLSCTGGSGSSSYSFNSCTNLSNCTGYGSGNSASYGSGFGFHSCTNLTNCTGLGSGSNGFGFHECTNLTNCTGTGTGGSDGYGFYLCNICSNCRSDPNNASTTAAWGGTNNNISKDTCPEYKGQGDVYPIGIIVAFYNNTSPASSFGGSWTHLNSVFLYSASSESASAGGTGGAETHKLTISEMPSHSHPVNLWMSGATPFVSGGYCLKGTTISTSYGVASSCGEATAKGSGTEFSILPPYMVVHYWRRTA